MLNTLKKIFAFKNSSASSAPAPLPPQVLGLKLGGSFTIDALKLKLAEPMLTIEGADSDHIIEAVGEVQLDPQRKLLRFYTDDEGFLQIQLFGEHIEEIILWYFYDVKAISTPQWSKVLNNQVAKSHYALEDQTFTQFWEGNTPVVLTEKTYHLDGSVSETDQFCMAYTREIDSQQCPRELLLISAEEKYNSVTNGFDRELVRSTGFALSKTDIQDN